jgi:5-methyltetrahydrofolate--homocysteine methyltransferase
MFDTLRCDEIGMVLTEGFAMTPAASVSAGSTSRIRRPVLQCRARIGDDQLKDYAARSGRSEDDLRRALAPVL